MKACYVFNEIAVSHTPVTTALFFFLSKGNKNYYIVDGSDPERNRTFDMFSVGCTFLVFLSL